MSALNVQVGGGHYKDLLIQPIEIIYSQRLPYCEANAIKYITRWRHKNGIEDLRKAEHYLHLAKEFSVRRDAGDFTTMVDSDARYYCRQLDEQDAAIAECIFFGNLETARSLIADLIAEECSGLSPNLERP